MVVFMKKQNIKSKDKIVRDLGDFILMNRVFFDVFCNLIIRCSEVSDYNKEFLEASFLIDPLIDTASKKTYEFIDKITEFFNTTNKNLDKRRGDIVEYLIEKIIPKTDTKEAFIKETEFYIYYNGSKFGTSNHDIDVGVYCKTENFIELYECKVKLKSFLYDRPPLKRKSRRKLGYLRKVYREMTNISNKDIFLVCLELNTLIYKTILDNYNYRAINIMNRNDIEKLVIKSGQDVMAPGIV